MDIRTLLGTDPDITVGDRRIETAWKLADLGDGVTEWAVLSVAHSVDRKRFYATITKEKRERSNGFTVRAFGLFSGVTIALESVGRFSMKGLTAFSKTALNALGAAVAADNAKVIELITASDRSCGCTGMYHAAGCEVYAASVRSGKGEV